MKTLSQIHEYCQAAIGYFFKGWKDGADVGCITSPWRGGYTRNREFDPYPEWSEMCLNYEDAITHALNHPEEETNVWEEFENSCQSIIDQYDN
jgi:hypothetical protein